MAEVRKKGKTFSRVVGGKRKGEHKIWKEKGSKSREESANHFQKKKEKTTFPHKKGSYLEKERFYQEGEGGDLEGGKSNRDFFLIGEKICRGGKQARGGERGLWSEGKKEGNAKTKL